MHDVIPILLTLGTFLVFSLIGLGALAAAKADTRSLRITLTAPVLGSATLVLPLFVASHRGAAMEHAAGPIVIVLAVASLAVLALRRPALPRAAGAAIGICVASMLLMAWPMFEFGFQWISNANDDMANYVLLATKLLHNGLLSPVDITALAHDRDYATAMRVFHSLGGRPGPDIMLAATSTVTGRAPYEIFMPLIVALNMSAICAAGALALQAARRSTTALVAAGLLAVSPLATYGVVQQLLPQVWGLGVAAALFALALRPELHRSPGARLPDLVPLCILFAAVIIVYVELAATLAAAYVLYVLVLGARRALELRAVARLWLSALITTAVVLNTYLPRELGYVGSQTTHGVSRAAAASPFGYVFVPAALPGIVGLRVLPADPNFQYLNLVIAVAALILVVSLVASFATAWRGVGAAIALVTYAVIAVALTRNRSDFGVFKLFMYIQPFLAAATAVWLSRINRRALAASGAAAVAALAVAQLFTQHDYVNRSRDPVDLPNASAANLLPAFRHIVATSPIPVVSVTANPVLAKLEAASVANRPLYFVSRNILATLPSTQERLRIQRHDGWAQRSFDLSAPSGSRVDRFGDNTRASAVLERGRCAVVLPTGTQEVMNRRSLPEGSHDLVSRRCGRARNLLVFTNSQLGQHFYLYTRRLRVSYYQLEQDFFFRGHTLSGLGRYLLFRVLDPSATVRVELAVTTTVRHDGTNRLPPASVVGSTREQLGLVGRGSAHLFSPPLHVQTIAGQPYVLLDMGADGQPLPIHRSGLAAAYGRSVILDPRFLTSYVRNISLLSPDEYRRLRAPSVLRRFPSDLANPNLEYSGIYEDGWVGEDSYVVLAAGHAAKLVLRADVLPRQGQRLRVRVDGRTVASRRARAGRIELAVPLPASSSRRRIELRWAGAVRLRAPDLRPAAAHLWFLGIVERP